MPAPSPGDIVRFLGPWPTKEDLDAEVINVEDLGSYERETVRYSVSSSERVTAFVNVPKRKDAPLPAVFCHHQHASTFHLGKSEVVGLAGDTDQTYAHELAQQGFMTIAPDAIGFEDRNWSRDGQSDVTWFELSRRLVQGRTLLASCLHEVARAIDYLTSRDDVRTDRIGFIGHSYGGRMAIWAPAFDPRIIASVSNCGCVPYRLSDDRQVGFQAEFVVPGFAVNHDLEDVIARYQNSTLLISAGSKDRYSRGAEDLFAAAQRHLGPRVELALYPVGHAFTPTMRHRAYSFLRSRLEDEADRADA